MKSLITLLFGFALMNQAASQTKAITYYANGQIKLDAFIKNNTYDSTYISYYENGNKQSEGTFKNCIYKTSTVSIDILGCHVEDNLNEPRHGITDGQWTEYYENGQTKSIKNYVCGIKVSQWLLYDSTGKLSENAFYNENRLIQKQEFNSNSRLSRLSVRTYESYKENKKDTFYKTTYQDYILEYYTTGELKCIKTVKANGKLIGEYIEYWENGFIKIKGAYVDGMKNGIFTEYYSNGNIKFKGEIRNNLPHDKQLFFNEQGIEITTRLK